MRYSIKTFGEYRLAAVSVNRTVIFLCLFAACCSVAFAQGGKAEPNRIRFAKGKTAATLSGVLSNDQEMEYVMLVRAGQTVRLKVTSKPTGRFFDFRIAGSSFELETDYDSYTEYSFTAPETGDYLIFVRKRPTERVKKATFYLSLTVK